jgi:hypothetical protein
MKDEYRFARNFMSIENEKGRVFSCKPQKVGILPKYLKEGKYTFVQESATHHVDGLFLVLLQLWYELYSVEFSRLQEGGYKQQHPPLTLLHFGA